LLDIVDALLDGPARVFKAKLISKWPGTEGYGLHHDLPYWSGLEPGDLALSHAPTPHRSGPNRSPHNREGLFLSYARTEHGEVGAEYYRRCAPGWSDPQQRSERCRNTDPRNRR
jgi:hypothetical protein